MPLTITAATSEIIMAAQGVGAGMGAGAAGTAGAVGAEGCADGTVIEGAVEDITTGPTDTAFTV